MPGATTRFAWPFPLPNEMIGQGADVIGQLAQKVESQIAIPDNALTNDSPNSAWPLGISNMAVTTSAQATAGNWPITTGGGTVITGKSGANLGFQLYIAGATNPTILYRWFGSTTPPTPWVSVYPGNTNIPTDSIPATAPTSSWPAGMSAMAVTSTNYVSLGYPNAAGVVTTYSGSGAAYQLYMSGSTTNLAILFRWYGSTPGPWISIYPGPTNLTVDSLTANDPYTSWPGGLSSMGVTTTGSTAGNWPVTGAPGNVTTYRGSPTNAQYQIYMGGSTTNLAMYFRYFGPTPGPWLSIYPGNSWITADTFSADVANTSWPAGMSQMAVSSANFAALNYPVGAGQVITVRNSTGSVGYQIYMVSTTPQMLFRWYGATPGPWKTLWGTGVPTAMATGTVSAAAVTANAVTLIPVTFPAGRFSQIPRVFPSIYTTTPDTLRMSVQATTTSGFNAYVHSTGPTTATFYWQAVEGAT